MDLLELAAQVKALKLDLTDGRLSATEDGRTVVYATVDADTLHLSHVSIPSGLRDIALADIYTLGRMSNGRLTIHADIDRLARDEQVIGDLPEAPPALPPVSINKTLASLSSLLPVLFPGIERAVYYDELAEAPIVEMAVFGRPDLGTVRLDDSTTVIYYTALEQALAARAIDVAYARRTMDEAMTAHLLNHRRNPFREWVEAHPWDGKERIATMFQRLYGATAPMLRESGEEDRYIGAVCRAWAVGAIARSFRPTRCEIVPVLISPDQGIGKGLATKFLAGRDAWYIDTSSDVSREKDFLDSTRGRIIVEMSESRQIRSADSDILKAFISKTVDQYRKPYGHYEQEFPRHFVLVASSNFDNVFTDLSGNRRFFPLYCDASRASLAFSQDRTVGQAEVEQFWAEALHAWQDGARPWLDEGEAALAATVQSFATVENPGVSVIDEWLDDPSHGYDQVGARVSKQIILATILGYNGGAIPADMEHAFRSWTNGTHQWRRCQQTVRIDGRPTRGYERVLAPGETRPVQRLRIVDPKAKQDVAQSFQAWIRDNGVSDFGEFDPARLPAWGCASREEELGILLMSGSVYTEQRDGKQICRAVRL